MEKEVVDANADVEDKEEGVCGGCGGCGGGIVRTEKLYDNNKYCRTYGYNIHDDHTSDTCNTPLLGHRHAATFIDNKGGYQNHRLLVV